MIESRNTLEGKDTPGEGKLYPISPDDIVNYFFDKRKNPGFQGYDKVAYRLRRNLDKMSKAVDGEEPRRAMLPLKPLDGPRPYELVRGDEPEASKALILLAEKLTRARVLLDNRDKKTGHGQVVSIGRWGRPIYFIENHTYDRDSEFMTWEIATDVPDDLLPVPLEPKPFVTTSEANHMTAELYYTLHREIPNAPIDEAEVVQSWIKRRAA